MNISQEKRQESVKYMTDEIKFIIEEFGDRDPGSAGEIKALEHYKKELTAYCDEVKEEKFPVYPHSFMGWVPFVTVFMILGLVAYFFSPIASLVCIVIAFVPLFGQFLFYRQMIDKLFEKRISGNVWGTIKPKGEVKRRIVLNGHSDAAYEWHWHRVGGYKLFLTSIVIPIIGVFVLIIACVISMIKGRFIGIVTPSAAPLEFYIGIFSLLFVPAFVCFYFFSDNKVPVPGANDNLTACEMALATVKAMKECGIRTENTEVVALITGSEEAGLRGAKFFVKNNPTYGKEEGIESIFITYETLRELNHLVVFNRDLNGLVKNDDQVSLLAKQCSEKNGMNPRYGSVFCGATDAAAFSQGGLKSTCFAAMSTEIQDYYHTRKDNWDNLDPACLAKVFDITLDMIDQFDAEGLPQVENTSKKK